MDDYTKRMLEIAKLSKDDPEVYHSQADSLLCEAVDNPELVKAYKKVKKWYA